MPELLEVEAYRQLAESVVGRRIEAVDAPDEWFLKGGLDRRGVTTALRGGRVTAARRRGKLLLLDVQDRPTVGLRFGMTGRLLVDGGAVIDRLQYATARDEPRWDRFGLRFAGGGDLRVSDPRRLGGVELEPDEDALGIDATVISRAALASVLRSSAPLKARLMDQRRVAGLGNLLVDETLWRASLAPTRPARGLGTAEVRRLHHHMRRTLAVLGARGGSHTGDLQDQRRPDGHCPRDGAPLRRETVGGRTTYWCPAHQVGEARA